MIYAVSDSQGAPAPMTSAETQKAAVFLARYLRSQSVPR